MAGDISTIDDVVNFIVGQLESLGFKTRVRAMPDNSRKVCALYNDKMSCLSCMGTEEDTVLSYAVRVSSKGSPLVRGPNPNGFSDSRSESIWAVHRALGSVGYEMGLNNMYTRIKLKDVA
jgi:hypothetical protein